MLLHKKISESQTDAEDGYILLAVLILVFFLLLSLSIAAPRVAKEIQRDKEQEAVERGLQYQRAIKLYYKKFGSYPTDVKQLEKTNDIRFLRRRYTDPMTGKDDWRIIHAGEAKVPPQGFFGEALQAGLSSQSTGPGLNGPGSSGAATGAGSGSTFGFNNSGSGSPGAGGAGAAGGFGNFGSSGQSTSGGQSGSGVGGAGFGGANGQPGQPSQGGFANGQPGQPGNGQPGQGGFANGPAGQSNSTFGGSAPIVGVGIPLDKSSQRVYHKQKKYSQWEFVYDPQQDLLAGVGGGNPAGIQQTGVATPGNANAGPNNGSGGFGFQNGPVSGGQGNGSGSGSGSGSGFGFGNGSGSGNGSGFGSSNPTPPPANPPQ